MSEQKKPKVLKQVSETSELQDPLRQKASLKRPSMGLFVRLPRELHLVVSNYLSLKGLGYLAQVNKFFMELTREIIFFSKRTKDLVSNIFFFPQSEEEKIDKRLLRERIQQAPKKVDLSGVSIYSRNTYPQRLDLFDDYAMFPTENVVLKDIIYAPADAMDQSINHYPTTLLNKVVLNILADAKKKRYFTYTGSEGPLGDHFVFLFYSGNFPQIYSKHEITVTYASSDFLEHSILYHFNMLPDQAEAKNTLKCYFDKHAHNANFALGFGCSDKETLGKMRYQLECLNFPTVQFSEECFDDLEAKYGKKGVCAMSLSHRNAAIIFLINPVHVALHLLDDPKYFSEEDFEQSCDVLLTEIEKFRGFSNNGIPDKELDALKNKLEAAKVQKRRSIAAIEKIQAVLANDSNDKLKHQSEFKAIINSRELSVVARAEIFNWVKNSDAFERTLNYHRNPQLDDFLGIENTTSWRDTWKDVRDNAKEKLFAEVDGNQNRIDKYRLLDFASFQPLFCDHRNNNVLRGVFGSTRGAFGSTQAVTDIETKLERLRNR